MLDIYATSIDYDPNSPVTRQFFATVQNKMHFAAHGHTAAEVVYHRADANEPNMGMSAWVGDRPTRREAEIAKNYLNQNELAILNRIVSMCLDFAELQAIDQKPVYMAEWMERIDAFLRVSGRQVLDNNGSVSKLEAEQKAKAEYEQYKKLLANAPSSVEQHFDRFVEDVKSIDSGSPKKPR